MLWYHYLIVVVFILMIASPAWFFRKIEHILFDEDEMDIHTVGYLNPSTTHTPDDSDEQLIRDEKVLSNLKAMVERSTNEAVKQLWYIKMLEFDRHLRWKNNLRRTQHVEIS